MRKHFQIQITDMDFTYTRDSAGISDEAALDGFYILRTSLTQTDLPRLGEPMYDSLRKFYFDTVVHDPTLLRALVEFAGPGHVLLGSDFPFDMGSDAQLTASETQHWTHRPRLRSLAVTR
jgi:hypothetical protein